MKKKMGIVLCAICMMTALFSFGIVYAEDEGTESPQEPAVVETYADPGEKTVVVTNQEDLHDAIDQANALGAAAIEAGVEMKQMTIELTSDIRFDSRQAATYGSKETDISLHRQRRLSIKYRAKERLIGSFR